MNLTDLLGYAAGLMTLVTFAQKRMLRMRIGAVTANVLFIGYGVMGAIYPVVVLHLALLPLNVIRLAEQCGQSANQPAAVRSARVRYRRQRRRSALRRAGTVATALPCP